MFDNVGKNRNQSRGRSASSLLLALLFNGSLISCIGYVTMKAPEALEAAKEKLSVIDLAPPPPPPPPPPAGGGSHKKKEKVEIVETPVDPTVLQEVPPPVPDEPDEPEGEGVKDGVVDGVKDGVVDGVKDGVIDGVKDGVLDGTGVKNVYWAEVQVKTRVVPEFPESARQLGLKNENCIVHVTINELGEPIDISFKACPELFKSAAKGAAMQWRWYPLMDNGRPVRAGFDLSFHFTLK